MACNVLDYQPHLLQHCHPACGQEESSHLSPVSTHDLLPRCKFSTLTPRQLMVEFYVTHSCSHAFRYRSQNKNPGFVKNRTHDLRTSDLRGYHNTPLGRRVVREP